MLQHAPLDCWKHSRAKYCTDLNLTNQHNIADMTPTSFTTLTLGSLIYH